MTIEGYIPHVQPDRFEDNQPVREDNLEVDPEETMRQLGDRGLAPHVPSDSDN